jgi:NIMA (never in mitosis gene a)-related kinase
MVVGNASPFALFGSRTADFAMRDTAGSGSYGTAYIVRCNSTAREMVLKVVKLYELSRVHKGDSPEEKLRKISFRQDQLMKEFVRASDISKDCPRFVRTETAWYEDQKFFILMEFCNKGTLQKQWDEVCEQWDNGEIFVREDLNHNPFIIRGGLAVFGEDAVPMDKIFCQFLEALAFLEYKSIAHLDLKPDNVFIDANGNLKIGDFGLAKSVSTRKGAVSTIQGNFYGTEGFMAPEITKKQPVNSKADVYSFGVILFSIVMLRFPKSTDHLPLRINEMLWPNNGIRASLAQRMLAEDPASRPSASEILSMLSSVTRYLEPRDFATCNQTLGARCCQPRGEAGIPPHRDVGACGSIFEAQGRWSSCRFCFGQSAHRII